MYGELNGYLQLLCLKKLLRIRWEANPTAKESKIL